MVKYRYGFLNVKIENNGTTLVGVFYTNDGKILDHFKLNNRWDALSNKVFYVQNYSIFNLHML